MKLPPIHGIEHITFPAPQLQTLKNGIPLYGFNGLKNDILRLDLVFNSGRWTEPAKLSSESAAKLFKSGTSKWSAFELSEQIDAYGSTIKAGAGYNTFTVSLYCMNRFLQPSLQLLLTCLTEIIFPEKEVALYRKNAASKLKVSLEKNDYVADMAFRKALYGELHPYGYETREEDIHGLTPEVLLQFYKQDIQPGNCTLFMAGRFADEQLQLIDTYLGRWTPTASLRSGNSDKIMVTNPEKKIRVTKEKAVQASIVIGKELFNKHHEDYAQFILLNTIFGGYFGSRLMSNIREDKGLTYGIYSGLSALKYGGTFSIQTDTNVDTLDVCLREIYLEMERLQNDLIPDQEITLARNYLLGKMLSRTDGPFHQVDVFKSYFVEGVDIHKFEEFAETIRQADAVALQRMARKYFLKESMHEVVVG